MQKPGVNEIREKYLSFFESKDHLRLPSFPLVPQGDNSLLLINSGMAPMKPYFSGEQTPPHPRVTTCQKCVRVIDIEQVGRTSRHCTFFEMLGHFSFGDYFKSKALAWTWEFYTEVMGIDPELLYCSVYLEDDEAWDIWVNEVGIPLKRMIRLGKGDNFWDVGSGPCGPCSEVYYDRGSENGCGSPDCAPGCDCDRFVEIGNNVFTQFNNDGAGNYTPLAKKNIDFGGGLERLACVVQGTDSVFGIDTMREIMRHAEDLAGIKHGASERGDVSLRIITDHIRSTVMLICDGVLPSNEGRGYVLRRLLRRAARHGKLLGITRPFLCEIAETVVRESGAAYPELIEKQGHICKIIRLEEERFEATVNAGLSLCVEMTDRLKAAGQSVFPGADAFRLYDTYGFPIELTLELLEEQNLTLDRAAFDAAMQSQRERARAARGDIGGWGSGGEELDLPGDETVFTGYTSPSETAAVLAVLDAGEDKTAVLLDVTPFYAESGGQTADTGVIENDSGVFMVSGVQKTKDGKFLHIGELVSGELNAGMTVSAKFDAERRAAIRRAHSTTHLLHKALREVLGTHAEQAGSLVEPDRLRFDFTHFTHLTDAELSEVRERVIEYIYRGASVAASEMPMDDARKKGAMALFGEKYGNIVRVVEMDGISAELCGGTHVRSTAEIGAFIMRGDVSIASGVRRIEAQTGPLVLREYNNLNRTVSELSAILKTPPESLGAKIEQQLSLIKTLRKSAESFKTGGLRADAERGFASAQSINGLRYVTLKSGVWNSEDMRAIGDYLRDKDPNIVAVVASTLDDRLTVTAVCGKNAVANGVKAGDIVKKICAVTGGGGGGRPDSAMGGGGDPSKLDDALKTML
ncbi:MAG: alanine--tRNA ligase [Oscillospiraceae bacterium]|nr:alanine--tRNA ligase [Oscillospiraceae bacterium]